MNHQKHHGSKTKSLSHRLVSAGIQILGEHETAWPWRSNSRVVATGVKQA